MTAKEVVQLQKLSLCASNRIVLTWFSFKDQPKKSKLFIHVQCDAIVNLCIHI